MEAGQYTTEYFWVRHLQPTASTFCLVEAISDDSKYNRKKYISPRWGFPTQ